MLELLGLRVAGDAESNGPGYENSVRPLSRDAEFLLFTGAPVGALPSICPAPSVSRGLWLLVDLDALRVEKVFFNLPNILPDFGDNG